jgi:REP element-mobilizing transposase RayT
MAHTYTNLLTHIVFSTKDRHPMLIPELRTRLFPYLGGIIRQLHGTALSIGGPDDHVHLLVKLHPSISVASVLDKLKSSSSGWIHRKWPERWSFAWQEGYGAFSVSPSHLPAVMKYIAGQEEHHRRVSFQDEFIELLKKYGIEYDERYIWK